MLSVRTGICLLSGFLAAVLQANPVAAQERGLVLYVGASLLKTTEELVEDKSIKIFSNLDGDRVIQAFCEAPDGEQKLLILSRKLSPSEMRRCEKDRDGFIGVQFASFVLGLVSNAPSLTFNATPKTMYLAIADDVPRSAIAASNLSLQARTKLLGSTSDNFIHNPFRTWRDIDASLPDIEIHFVTTEAGTTRLILDGRVLEAGCRDFSEVKKVFSAELRKRLCTQYRKDGHVTMTSGTAFLDTTKDLLSAKKPTLGLLPHSNIHVEGLTIVPQKGVSPSDPDFNPKKFTTRRDTSVYFFERTVIGNGPSQDPSASARFLEKLLSEPVIGPGGKLEKAGFFVENLKDRQNVRNVIRGVRGISFMGGN